MAGGRGVHVFLREIDDIIIHGLIAQRCQRARGLAVGILHGEIEMGFLVHAGKKRKDGGIDEDMSRSHEAQEPNPLTFV